jgi:E3 ubiquitin-protein ligase HECTD4
MFFALCSVGSFRHFLGSAVEEFKKPDLNMLMPCPSSAAGHNKDSLILRPGPLSYGEEKLMSCLGQVGLTLI